MRHACVFPLVAVSIVAAIGYSECAYAQTNPYALDRLFLDPSNVIPFNEVLSFNSVTEVENYFGLRSIEAHLANDFFAGYTGSSANMLFARFVPGAGRARLYGGNVSGLSLAQLQTINGALSITSQGYTFSTQVNLAHATSLSSAAYQIQSALDAVQPTVATTMGSYITPASASFTGSIKGGLMDVTAVSGGPIAIGGVVTSPKRLSRTHCGPKQWHAGRGRGLQCLLFVGWG
jgi:hypothetical protein